MFRHILLIKDNSIFVNQLPWYWIRHYVFDWLISLIITKVFWVFLLSRDFCIQRLHLFYTSFFISHKKTREREWMSKQCQKLRSKVKEGFRESIYIYIYILCTTSHIVILSRRQSYLVYKSESIIDLSFSVSYLRFSIYWQYFFFLNLALNLSSFCSLLCSFTALPPHFRVKVALFVKHNSSESSTNKARFRKFCKRLSIYPWFIRYASNLPVLSFQMFWQKHELYSKIIF